MAANIQQSPSVPYNHKAILELTCIQVMHLNLEDEYSELPYNCVKIGGIPLSAIIRGFMLLLKS